MKYECDCFEVHDDADVDEDSCACCMNEHKPVPTPNETKKEAWADEFYELTKTMDGQDRPKLRLLVESAIALERNRIREGVEKIMGKEGSFSGSLGYQGFVNGVHAIQTHEDRQRDKILTLIDSQT